MSCCAATIASPEQLQETKSRIERLEQDAAIASSIKLGPDRYKTEFIVPDIHCASCIGVIERGLETLAPVEQVRANLSQKMVGVIWSPANGNFAEIPASLEQLGFENHINTPDEEDADNNANARSLLLALAVAGFAAANVMLLSVSVWSGADAETAKLFHLLSGLIAVPAVAFSGQPFFRSALNALAARRLNMDVPISLAVLLGLAMSVFESLTGGTEAYFDASVMLLFFLLIGRYLEQMMRNRARGAVERLHALSAKHGLLIDEEGELRHIPLTEIRPGMRLRVFAGERFPVNARIIAGASDIDRSHVSGESENELANAGCMIEAGALNLTGTVDVEALSTSQDSFLGEMRKMMEVAEEGRSNYLRVADRMARIYAPAVHLLALTTFLGWMFVSGADWQFSLYTAIAVLIITCPCALGLAVPVAHVIGANRLMQSGILMRDGSALERLAEVDAVVFDKTGTLTTNRPAIVSATGVDEKSLPVLTTLADNSSHPSARALADYFSDVDGTDVDDFREHAGKGVEAKWNGHCVRLGRSQWVSEIASQKLPESGSHCISFAVENLPPAHFEAEDTLRAGSVSATERLMRNNIELGILSGDRPAKVKTIAEKLKVHSFFHSQLPGEKIRHVQNVADCWQEGVDGR